MGQTMDRLNPPIRARCWTTPGDYVNSPPNSKPSRSSRSETTRLNPTPDRPIRARSKKTDNPVHLAGQDAFSYLTHDPGERWPEPEQKRYKTVRCPRGAAIGT